MTVKGKILKEFIVNLYNMKCGSSYSVNKWNILPYKGGVSMSFKLEFSGDLCRARKERGWSQKYVAEAVSISQRGYQNIESGKVMPHVDTFLKLVFLFELDIEKYREVL